jgi:hypothetical protein
LVGRKSFKEKIILVYIKMDQKELVMRYIAKHPALFSLKNYNTLLFQKLNMKENNMFWEVFYDIYRRHIYRWPYKNQSVYIGLGHLIKSIHGQMGLIVFFNSIHYILTESISKKKKYSALEKSTIVHNIVEQIDLNWRKAGIWNIQEEEIILN